MILEMAVHDTPLAQTVFVSTYSARLSKIDATECMCTIYASGISAVLWSVLGIAAQLAWKRLNHARTVQAVQLNTSLLEPEVPCVAMQPNEPCELLVSPN